MMPSKQLREAPIARLLAAMAVAFVFGLAMSTVECPALARAFGEIKRVISLAIAKAVVPLLPFYILTVVADLTARGSLAQVCGPSVKIIMTAVAATWLVLVVQYATSRETAR